MALIQNIQIGNGAQLVLIAGPCVVESRELIFKTASALKEICEVFSLPLIFKSSYKKANRTSIASFTGIPMTEALEILDSVRSELGIPVVTDVHTIEEVSTASQYVDMLQIPAFLCRQTDLLIAAGASGRAVNIKKGQFLAPEDMRHAVEKVRSTGNENILLTERGTTFGYHNLVVDMRSLVIMRALGVPVVMDATHSVQLPSHGTQSGGQPQYIASLAAAAAAVGIDALFLEVHPNPKEALSDAESQLSLAELPLLLKKILAIDSARKDNS